MHLLRSGAMVAKIIKSSPILSLAVFLGICGATLVLTLRLHQPPAAIADNTFDPPASPTSDEEIDSSEAFYAAGTLVPWCANHYEHANGDPDCTTCPEACLEPGICPPDGGCCGNDDSGEDPAPSLNRPGQACE